MTQFREELAGQSNILSLNQSEIKDLKEKLKIKIQDSLLLKNNLSELEKRINKKDTDINEKTALTSSTISLPKLKFGVIYTIS